VNAPSKDEELLTLARRTQLYETTLNVKEAVQDADFIYTDTWVDMEFFSNSKYIDEKKKRIDLMKPYQINKKLIEKSNAYIMHDMPIHRDYEISSDIIEGPKSIIYTQSENRLYSAKAILLKILNLD
jgi:ornithine carbamoyltransferase